MNKKRLVIYDAKTNTVTSWRDNRMTHTEDVSDAKQSFNDRVLYKNERGKMEFRDGYTHSFGLAPEKANTTSLEHYIHINIQLAFKHKADDKLLLVDIQEDGSVAFMFSYRKVAK